MSNNPGRVLILGAGYLGTALADRLAAEGREVFAASRTNPRDRRSDRTAGKADDERWRWLAADVTRRQTLVTLPECPAVVVCVGHQRGGKTSADELHRIGMSNLLDAISKWSMTPNVVLVSTTGVYAQTGGVWVDQRSVARPNRESAKAHLRGEDVLRHRHPSGQWTILRMSGLYGPERLPQVQRLVRGDPIAADPDTYLNLVHRDDAVAAMHAAIDRSIGGLFCVSDDTPVLRGEYYRALASAVGGPPPTFQTAADASRRQTNRRVDNRRVKTLLVPKLSHPRTIDGVVETVREGDR